jgi:hypothetical protein
MPVMKGWPCMIVGEKPVPALETSVSENEAANTNLPTVDGFSQPNKDLVFAAFVQAKKRR